MYDYLLVVLVMLASVVIAANADQLIYTVSDYSIWSPVLLIQVLGWTELNISNVSQKYDCIAAEAAVFDDQCILC